MAARSFAVLALPCLMTLVAAGRTDDPPIDHRLAKSLWRATQSQCDAQEAGGVFIQGHWRSVNVLRAIDGTIVIAFPGGGSLASLIRGKSVSGTAAEVFGESFELIKYPTKGCKECLAGITYIETWTLLRPQVFDLLDRVLRERHGPIAVVGNSVGSPLAMLCAIDLAERGNPLVMPKWVYIFGSPRVGNKAFAEHLNSLYPDSYYSYSVHGDIITYMPPVDGFVTPGGIALQFKPSPAVQDGYTMQMCNKPKSDLDPCKRSSTKMEEWWNGATMYLEHTLFARKNYDFKFDVTDIATSSDALVQNTKRMDFWEFLKEALSLGEDALYAHNPSSYLKGVQQLGFHWAHCKHEIPDGKPWRNATMLEMSGRDAVLEERLAAAQAKIDAMEHAIGSSSPDDE